MKLWKRKKPEPLPAVQTAPRGQRFHTEYPAAIGSYELFEQVRRNVPLIDAAISKLVRLIGTFRVECEDRGQQAALDRFFREVPVGLTGQSVYSFIDSYFDSLLVYGNAVGEIVLDRRGTRVEGLWNGRITDIGVRAGETPMERVYVRRCGDGTEILPHPERILFTSLKAPNGGIYGVSLLQGVPALAGILLRIYECVGENFDRAGNIRYAVTYRPTSDATDMAFAGERAKVIAQEWADGMKASRSGEVRDFVAVGDVDIKVIGADGEMPETEIPVRQLLEQILAKLSVPPFLLGLNWSSTERMSAQQADILTSELEYYRRLLEPAICRIAQMYLRLNGSYAPVRIVWDNINLQDEVELAQARLHNAQALEIETRLGVIPGQ